MKRSIPSLLVLGLLAALLVSCGQSATVQQAVATPTAASHTHTGRIAWQGFLDPNQTTAAIFSANADGSDVRQLTQPNRGEQDGLPEWSPNGSKILFARIAASGPSDVWVMNADGSGLKQLTHYIDVGNGAQWGRWSPDGSQIVYSVAETPIRPEGWAWRESLWIMQADGSHARQLTNPPLPTSIADNSPAWSPDGTKIIFAHRSSTGADQNAHLYVMNADGSGLLQITHNPFWQLQPAWSSAP
jgi:TolB protein